MNKHSETPWGADAIYSGNSYRIVSHRLYHSDGSFATLVNMNALEQRLDNETCKANAAFIVESVNNHDRLVAENERLRAALERINKDIYTALLYKRIYKGVAEDMSETIEQALKGE